jgi:hypothetical protein
MDYFSRKSLSKHLMDTIDFNKHDIDISIKDMWQKKNMQTIVQNYKAT